MVAELLEWNSELNKDFSRSREIVRAGGVIAYPTDTFYGLGADPRNPDAVRKIFSIKGRQPDQPILLLLHDRKEVNAWASSVTPLADKLMKRYWPGPLTLLFRAAQHVLPELTAGTGTIGLRVPGNERTRSLLKSLGTALTGTSANRSGAANPRTADDVLRELGDRIDLVLDGGPSPDDRPSTIVDVTGDMPRVLRKGAIDIDV